MSEVTIKLEHINPIEFFGTNHSKLNQIKKAFPKLKVNGRGNVIRAQGSEFELEDFSKKIYQILGLLEKYGNISATSVEAVLSDEKPVHEKPKNGDPSILVYGPGGNKVKAKTPNQQRMVQLSNHNDVVFALGPAGTGKTYTAVALAVRALKNKEVRKIILTRPAVEAGESLGFLPGDLKEKVDPYLRPLYDALDDMIPLEKLNYFMANRVIEIAPLAFMRGRTLDHAFIILDEAQNATDLQIKMFLTRIGASAKAVITGDMTQTDLPRRQKSGLIKATKILKDVDGIGMVRLTERDVVRHKLVRSIIKAYEKDHTDEERGSDEEA